MVGCEAWSEVDYVMGYGPTHAFYVSCVPVGGSRSWAAGNSPPSRIDYLSDLLLEIFDPGRRGPAAFVMQPSKGFVIRCW